MEKQEIYISLMNRKGHVALWLTNLNDLEDLDILEYTEDYDDGLLRQFIKTIPGLNKNGHIDMSSIGSGNIWVEGFITYEEDMTLAIKMLTEFFTTNNLITNGHKEYKFNGSFSQLKMVEMFKDAN